MARKKPALAEADVSVPPTPTDVVAFPDASRTEEDAATTEPDAVPALDVVQRSLTEIPEAERAELRGLMANNREMSAMRKWRARVVELGLADADPGLAAAKEACEYIAAQAPAPADFVLPVVDPDPEETLADGVVHPPGDRPVEGEPVRVVEPLTGRRVLKTGIDEVRVKLDDDELLARGRAMAQEEANIAAEEIEQQVLKRTMRERLSGMRGERARLAGIVSSGCEVRSVKVTHEADYDAGVIRIIDEATGRVLTDRPMEGREKQITLPLALTPTATETHSEGGDEWPVEAGTDDAAPDEGGDGGEE